jgi:fused signal recognition particle receptor
LGWFWRKKDKSPQPPTEEAPAPVEPPPPSPEPAPPAEEPAAAAVPDAPGPAEPAAETPRPSWLRRWREKAHPSPETAPPEPETAAPEPEVPSEPEPAVAAEEPPPPPAQEPASAAPAEDEPEEAAGPVTAGMFGRLKQRLSRTRDSLSSGFARIVTGKRKIDAQVIEDLEELLITADVGVQTATVLIERITAARPADADELQEALRDQVRAMLTRHRPAADVAPARPHVIMVVGVNGVGKTTTIGKLAARYTAAGRRVVIAAADTFRAAAVDQLAVWAERAGAALVRHRDGTDPAAVAYDAVDSALSRNAEVVIVDTAGRLHTKVNLMEEIKKVKRSIAKRLPDAPHEVLLVLDATTGQNAVSQARLFHEALGVTGIALTKLDGTAKGGIVLAICDTFHLPLRYIGIGEAIEDLQDFDPEGFVEALFSED